MSATAFALNTDVNNVPICQALVTGEASFSNVYADAATHALYVKEVGAATSEAAGGAAAPTNTQQTGGKANAAEPVAVDENDIVPTSHDLAGNTKVVGNVAHDGADTGCPVKIGAKGNAEEPAAANAENDRVNVGADLYGNLRNVGNIAHSTADRGNPLKVGFKAYDPASLPADVTAADRADAISDLKGRQIVSMDEVFAAGGAAAPTKTVQTGGRCDTTTPSAVDDGDAVPFFCDTLGRLHVIDDLTSGATDAAAPTNTQQVGGVVNASANAVDEGDLATFSFTLGSEARVILEAVTGTPDSAAPTKALQIAGVGNASANTLDEGDMGALSLDLASQLRTVDTNIQAAGGAAAPTNTLQVGGKANAASPAAVDENDIVPASLDLSGNQKIVGNIAHGTADAGNPVKTGGKASTARPSAVSNADRVNQYFDEYGHAVNVLDRKDLTLKSLAAETVSTNGDWMDVGGFGYAEILLNVTVADTDAGDTLDVYIDATPDDGTTVINIVHFAQVIGTDSASKPFAIVNSKGATGTAVTAAAADLTTTPDIRHFLGAKIRYRSVIVDAGGDDASFTYSVTANLKH